MQKEIKLSIITAMSAVLFATASATAQTVEVGVVINDVTWATRNVDASGTFAATPESAGMLYRWSSQKPVDCYITDWRVPGGTAWTKDDDPSPAGWHVPTTDEQETLMDTAKVTSVWVTLNGVGGRIFTDRISGNSIFMPAGSLIGCMECKLGNPNGFYWNSTCARGEAFFLSFGPDYVYRLNTDCNYGFSVRSVRDTPSGIRTVSLSETFAYVTPAGEVIVESSVAVQSLTLFDVTGKIAVETRHATALHASALPAGVYFLQINTAQGSVIKKIIK